MGAARPDGLAPLPRRVPQTSLAVELREDAPALGEQEDADEFTADHAASSLAGFQLGTLRARDEDDVLDTLENTTRTGTDPLGTPGDGWPGAPANSAPAGETPPTDRNSLASSPGNLDAAKDAPADEPLRGSPEDEPPPGSPEKPAPAQPAPPDAPQDAPVAARSPRIDRS